MPTRRPPLRHGVPASFLYLPERSPHRLLIDHLAERFPAIARADWAQRMAAGAVLAEHGTPLPADAPFAGRTRIWYYRCPVDEPTIACAETVLFQDAYLVVADKPHFLPVVPTGAYLQHTLLVRLKRKLGLPELSPIHRIDRDTAGLVLFSVQRATRGRYQALFRERTVRKVYEAVAPWRPELVFPRQHHSRMEESGHFFRMHEVPGAPNSFTRMELLEVAAPWARYRLEPLTGKRHQLRVHMSALGLPLRGDAFYPEVNDPPEGDYSNPLQLLAQQLAFLDPVTGEQRVFHSQLQLRPLA